MPFSAQDLARIDRTKEVRIETSMPGGAANTVIIWAVVDQGDVFVRSWKGANARWYRQAVANPEVALLFAGRRLPARAVAATDPDSIARTSSALERKYAGDPATKDMVRDEILGTTLRLESAPASQGEPGA
jgi:hypothetical protein